jgi:hypothetical protein
MSSSALAVRPAYSSAPDYWKTLGDEVADLCALADFEPDPEQKLCLDQIFAVNKFGKSVAFEFCVVCSRQNLKTGLFKQAALGWLFITDQRLVIWSAHEFDTAEEAHRDMAALIEDTPFLNRRLKHVHNASNDKSIELKSGQRLKFKARTKTGGRGLSGDKIVLDEAFALKPDHMGALMPTLSVRPDPQIVYGSSAGLADSAVLRGIRDRGRLGSSARLAYNEWCAAPGGCEDERCEHAVGTLGCALDRIENWACSNPLLGRTRANGTGLTVEYVQAEREAMAAFPLEFARERLGWWDEPGAAEIFGPGKWEACAGVSPSGLKIGALAVAITEDLSRAAIVAAGTYGERVVVKPLQSGPRWDWVMPRALELYKTHKVPLVVDGNGPAKPLIPFFVADGIDVHVASGSEVLDAFAVTYRLVQDARLLHGRFEELDASLNGATTRSVGDRKTWARRQSSSDLSVVEAMTLAAWRVAGPLQEPPPPAPAPRLVPKATSVHPMQTAGF